MAELNALDIFGENLTIKQLFFDASHPIGSTYTQYPQQDSPQTLFDDAGVTSTWEVVNYDGAFFRAQGTNANAFIEKTGVLSKQSQSTAKNGLSASFSGSSGNVSVSGASHDHGGNTGYTDINHTHSGTTEGMNKDNNIDRSKGSFSFTTSNIGRQEDGCCTLEKIKGFSYGDDEWNGGDAKVSIDVSHTHDFTTGYMSENNDHNHSISSSGILSMSGTFTPSGSVSLSGDTETRPTNYTIRVWKRTA